MPLRYAVLATLSRRYPPPEGRLPTCYSPVRHATTHPKAGFAFDLHVLGTPPALILSQDQTLSCKLFDPASLKYWIAPSSSTDLKSRSPPVPNARPRGLALRTDNLPSPVLDKDTLYLVFKHRSKCVGQAPKKLPASLSLAGKHPFYPDFILCQCLIF